jgi:hypothetical protein
MSRVAPCVMTRSPCIAAAATHIVSTALAWALTPATWRWDVVEAGCAVFLGWLVGLPTWWLVISAVFVPALTWCLELEASPLWGLGAFVALLLVYGSLWRSRVPLFFSSSRAQLALIELLPPGRVAFLDVGCGDGRVLHHLAAARRDSRFEGIEHAILPWLLARVRCWRFRMNCLVRRGDLWASSLAPYDVVYAYLSPAVMPQLWRKAQAEMQPGALLVTAFSVPGVCADRHVLVDDALCTELHVLRIDSARPDPCR